MPRSLSYADATKMLGGADNKVVSAIDKLMCGTLLAASATGHVWALGLFDAKDQLVRLSQDLIASLTSKVNGAGRIDRTDQIAAAHAVIVLTAYFETLSETEEDLSRRRRSKIGIRTRSDLTTTADDEEDDGVSTEVSELIAKMRQRRQGKPKQVNLVTGQKAKSSKASAIAFALLHAELPLPTPQEPYEDSLRRIKELYSNQTRELPPLLIGPDLWEPLEENIRRSLLKALLDQVPDRAITRYESLQQALAADFPEVSYWANRVDQQATRAVVRQVQVSLSSVQEVLAALACGRIPDERREALARFYKSALERQIAETGEVPSSTVTIPTLGRAYIDPNFRVANVGQRDRPDIESWWEKHHVRTDIDSFLTGFLTSPDASTTLLMVLGQPGSGKSVLTKVLGARLPADQFLAIRVVLREVPADADVQTQIEYAIRDVTGENLTWPELARSAPGALPVVLLDGFDELLQATGVSQSDYLEKVARFQEREAIQGRRVAFLITSRTAVADRARIPVAGVVCIHLEPFSPDQVGTWVAQWNEANSAYLSEQALQPLTTQAVLAQRGLAEQPLLLLMLALYDADSNALQRVGSSLSHVQLYERLLHLFAEREVRKERPDLDGEALAREVDRQLLRLSIAAYSMFNRGRQWSTQTELDADIAALYNSDDGRSAPGGSRVPLTAAQLVMGQFFFIHQAQAVQDGKRLHAFEFLHATFGEYLVARIVAGELRDLAMIEAFGSSRSRYSPPDYSYLRALLSFTPLSNRGTIVDYLTQLVRQLDDKMQATLGNLLKELFRITFAKPDSTVKYASYEPIELDLLGRLSTYSANLLLLVILAVGEVTASELFPDAEDAVDAWRRVAMLWRTALPEQGWLWLATSLAVRRTSSADRRDIIVSLPTNPRSSRLQQVDLFWSYNLTGLSRNANFHGNNYLEWQAEALFVADETDDVMAHALEPLYPRLSASVTAVVATEGRSVSAANALMRLWVASTTEEGTAELTEAYEDCIRIALHGFDAVGGDESAYRRAILHLLTSDRGRLPRSWCESIRHKLNDHTEKQGEAARKFADRFIVKLDFRLK